MARARTEIIHLAGYVPASGAVEYERHTGNVGHSNSALQQTSILHPDNDPPPVSAANELDRWSTVLDNDTSNREEILTKVRNLHATIRTAHAQYVDLQATGTATQRTTFVQNTYDDVLRVLGLLVQAVGNIYTDAGV